MTKIPLGRGEWKRSVARSPELLLKNRYFEANPVLTTEPAALMARPGLRKALDLGDGPVRGIFSAAGAFEDAAFVMSGVQLFQIDTDGVDELIGPLGSSTTSAVYMAATGTVGDTIPNYLYICDGGTLYLYTDVGFAYNFLNFSGQPANSDQVRIGAVYYQYTTGSVDSGSPAGTSGNPWLVARGTNQAEAVANLQMAINNEGLPGTNYSTSLVAHPLALAYSPPEDAPIAVRAKVVGAAGMLTTTETSANMNWSNATLVDYDSQGGHLTSILMPDDVGVISVAHINGYIIVVPAQDEFKNGRFYWINPGETWVDPLNYATTERAPDPILQVRIFSDQIMFLGESTTENWVTTGDGDAPFQRFSGVLFDRGIWEGTAVQVKESVIVVDSDGFVLQIGGGVKEISNPAIVERIRRAIQLEKLS